LEEAAAAVEAPSDEDEGRQAFVEGLTTGRQ
jgi:hypothetical protein